VPQAYGASHWALSIQNNPSQGCFVMLGLYRFDSFTLRRVSKDNSKFSIKSDGITSRVKINAPPGVSIAMNATKIHLQNTEEASSGGSILHHSTDLSQLGGSQMATSDGSITNRIDGGVLLQKDLKQLAEDGRISNEVHSGELVQTGSQIRAKGTGEILTKLDQVSSAIIDSNNIEGNMPAIKATNSRNITVKNSRFFGFDTAIELDNVDGFVSDNNTFAEKFDPQVALSELSQSIQNSALDNSSKERLAREVIHFLTSQSKDETQKTELTNRLKFLGGKAAEHFMRLVTAVAAGLIVHAVT